MSALGQTVPQARAWRPVRVGIRDGEIVQLRVCSGCGQEKICRLGPDSEFPRNGTRKGLPIWKSRCKGCSRRAQKEYRAANAERLRRNARAVYRQRILDPAYVERSRQRNREWKRRYAQDPVKRERMLSQRRESKRAQREREPERFREEWRLWYALDQERKGRMVRRRTTVIDGTQPRIPLGPFQAWLKAYKRETGYSAQELAQELGMTGRRVRSVLKGESERVALDIVCRVLTHAPRLVVVDDVLVVTMDDLYREEN